MSSMTLLLALALASLGPPTLPPEPVVDQAPPATDPPPSVQPPQARTTLPPGLQPVPFPLEQQRRAESPPGSSIPLPQQAPNQPQPRARSIVDLRDPFDRPPPRPPAKGQRPREHMRMLMPDLKDPFAQAARQVRSTTLERHVPNDIRDPFRDRPRPQHPPCTKTTDDGTVVQAPNNGKATSAAPACKQSDLDLHDPFTREAAR